MTKHQLLIASVLVFCAVFLTGPAMALSPAPCPAFTGCTAKDVTTTLSGAEVLSPNGMCEPGNTIRLNLTVLFSSQSTRRDVGVYLANDGKILLDPVDPATVCSGDYGYIPPFLDIDGGGDTCGDINGAVAWTFTTTVPCNGGQYNVSKDLGISSCRFWEQPGANTFCTSLTETSPGTSSKCDCSPFIVTPALSFCATTNCDDGSACTADSCDEAANRCVNTPVTCNDGNACTTDTCDPASGCVYTPVTCTALDQCHVAGTCDPGTGTCSNPAAPDGTGCNDGSLCTQTDTCQAGTCAGTNPVICTALDQCHAAGTCDPGTGTCSNPVAPDGTACNDSNACTAGDTCAAGVCAGGPAPSCDDGNVCTDDSCDPSGGCVHTNNTAPCNDGNACTTGETCSAGVCAAGNPVVCTALDQCHIAGTCDPATGTCSNPAANDGTACNDGSLCTQGDTCQAGTCVAGPPVICTALDQCHLAGVCDPGTGACSNPMVPDGMICSDGNACTIPDICLAGSCLPGPALNCDDANACTADVCDPAAGNCIHTDNSARCNDNNACTSDVCDTSIGCVNTDNSARCDDNNVCTLEGCNPTAGCTTFLVLITCNDGNACTNDTCDPVMGCVFPPVNCDDGNPCTTDSCNAVTGCVHVDDCCRPSQCKSICSSIGVGTIWSGIPTPPGNGCAGTADYWLGNPCMLNPIFSPAASGGCNLTFSTGYVNVTTADAARRVLDNSACAVCEKTAGNETVTWENPLNPLYRQTLSTELSINNCIGNRWANPKDVRPVLLDVEDFLLETSCQAGCNLTRAQVDQISSWNSYLGEFNAGRFWNGPEPCLPCALPTTSPAPTQQLNAYILLK